jgi:predicted Holliday junction resolvase-like endonuclease
VQRSWSVLGGMIFAEQLERYLPNFPFSPTEAKFIGAPIHFLVFKGMDGQSIEEVIFVEVKSGSARLNHNEHSLKDAIENKRVLWQKYHVPARLTNSPDTATEPAL